MSRISTISAPRVTDASFEDLRDTSLSHMEVPGLFSATATPDDEDDRDLAENEAGETVSSFATPYNLWAVRTGRHTPLPRPASLWSRMKMIPIEDYAAAQGAQVRRADPLLHPSRDTMWSRPDAEISQDGRLWEPVLCLPVNSFQLDQWRDLDGCAQVSDSAFLMAAHTASVRAAERVHVLAMTGLRVQEFVLERDELEETIAELEQTVDAFFDCVAHDVQPDLQGRDMALFSVLNARTDDEAPMADFREDEEKQALVLRLEELKAERKAAEKEIKEINETLRAALAGQRGAVFSETHEIVWQKRASYERKASTIPASAHLATRKIKKKA
ncbi:hypothetical protein [Tranquillimonas alkanivorans]|uniref:Phage-related protein, predicted endonuclease n=1 Tax=Tranquillimonas alkanivorans TaxID=441119 RepID=A0A1I5V2T2_9RHOB|nr:hypothetical protein [Tranquillimonas alkanivorans]SFQ01627.1 Phage-related protein, predicted endonuclease [Tranquillimonas alkanivorans]